jgi:hypothetical protein
MVLTILVIANQGLVVHTTFRDHDIASRCMRERGRIFYYCLRIYNSRITDRLSATCNYIKMEIKSNSIG